MGKIIVNAGIFLLSIVIGVVLYAFVCMPPSGAPSTGLAAVFVIGVYAVLKTLTATIRGRTASTPPPPSKEELDTARRDRLLEQLRQATRKVSARSQPRSLDLVVGPALYAFLLSLPLFGVLVLLVCGILLLLRGPDGNPPRWLQIPSLTIIFGGWFASLWTMFRRFKRREQRKQGAAVHALQERAQILAREFEAEFPEFVRRLGVRDALLNPESVYPSQRPPVISSGAQLPDQQPNKTPGPVR